MARISQHNDHNLEEVCFEHGHDDVGIELVVQEAEVDAAYVHGQLVGLLALIIYNVGFAYVMRGLLSFYDCISVATSRC